MDLRQDAGEKAFVLSSGEKIRNVEDLGEKLLSISEQDYAKHANSQKNDFSNWVKDVYGDKSLSDKLAKSKNPAEASAAIKKRLSETAPKITTEVVKAPKSSHTTVHKVASPKVMKIKIPKEKPKTIRLQKKTKKIRLQVSSKKSNEGNFLANLLKKKPLKQKSVVPDAHNFLKAYMAMERPTVSHLYFSKGIADFLLGVTIGIVIGIILAHVIM